MFVFQISTSVKTTRVYVSTTVLTQSVVTSVSVHPDTGLLKIQTNAKVNTGNHCAVSGNETISIVWTWYTWLNCYETLSEEIVIDVVTKTSPLFRQFV